MSHVKTTTRPAATYETDFYAWTQDQAARLRDLRPNALDWVNIAEEIESLGRSDKHAIESNLNVILVHLLKLRFQPEAATPGWRSLVREHRRRIARIVRDSPSLRRYPHDVLAEEYADARERAADETGLSTARLPLACPFTTEQVLDPDFWPEPAGE